MSLEARRLEELLTTPSLQHVITRSQFITRVVQRQFLACRISIAVLVHPEDPARQTVRKDAVTQFLGLLYPLRKKLIFS